MIPTVNINSPLVRRDEVLRLRAGRPDAVRLQERPVHRQRRPRGGKAAGRLMFLLIHMKITFSSLHYNQGWQPLIFYQVS